MYAYVALASARDPFSTSAGSMAVGKLGAVSSIGPEYRLPYLQEQVARLKAIKTILLAMEVREAHQLNSLRRMWVV